MRDTVSALHGANLSIAVFLQRCAGGAPGAVCPRADVRRLGLPPQIGATAARRLALTFGHGD